MPNGNVLMVVWDKKTADEAIAAGRKKELVSDYLLPDSVVEIKPTGKTTGEVVWEWHLWDHLVQDHDSTKANYGDVAAHPELVDINFVESSMGPGPAPAPARSKSPPRRPPRPRTPAKKAEAAKLKSLGYVGSPTQRSQRINPDWTHVNSVDYNAAARPDRDQRARIQRDLDHRPQHHDGRGRRPHRRATGKGGDLLYRWGNPRVYRAGTKADQTLFAQHNAHWIPPGFPGEGHMLVFNNGGRRPDGSYSSVDELVLPVDAQGRYALEPGKAFGPKEPIWSYSAPKKSDFYAFFISGAHRLPNGNTMICSGPNGTLFEVTPEKEVVWKYVNPVKGGFGPGGPGGPGGRRARTRCWLSFLQDMLGLSAEQKKEIESLQKTVDETLAKVLTDEQKKKLRERSGPGPGGMGAMPVPGQFMSVATQVTLKPTRRTEDAVGRPSEGGRRQARQASRQRISGNSSSRCALDFARGGPPGGPGGRAARRRASGLPVRGPAGGRRRLPSLPLWLRIMPVSPART